MRADSSIFPLQEYGGVIAFDALIATSTDLLCWLTGDEQYVTVCIASGRCAVGEPERLLVT